MEDPSLLWPDGCGPHEFKHRDIPDDDCETWYYPSPVSKIEESTPTFTPEQTQYIFCATKRTCLAAFRFKDPKNPDDTNIVQICTGSGERVGKLHLHNESQAELCPEHSVNTELLGDSSGKTIESVAICKTRHYRKRWDEKNQKYTGPCDTSEVFDVLWVEWENDVAYRLASGTVDKECWEGLELEDISLVLG